MSREHILSNLRTSLASSRGWLEDEANRSPRSIPPYVHPSAENLADQFSAELRSLSGTVYRVDNDAEAIVQIGAILAEKGASQIMAWDVDQIGVAGLSQFLIQRHIHVTRADIHGDERTSRLQRLDPVTVCISGADVGIAESGSLLLCHGPGRPRLASLLAPYHIAVLRSDQIVRGLGDALAHVRTRYGTNIFTDTSNLTLITGPSRTADIEMTLSLGIHGPQEIHVIVISTGI